MSLHPHLIALSERIRDHLLAQQARAYEGRCRYRTESGRTCAIGSQIDDDDYRPEFDSNMAPEEEGDTQVCLLADAPEILYCVRRSAARLGLPLLPADDPSDLLEVLLRGWQLYHDDLLHIGQAVWIAYGDWLHLHQADASPEAAHTYLLATLTERAR